MYAGFALFTVCCFIYFSTIICWLLALTYSLISSNKRRTSWLIVLGFIGFLPILIFAFNRYTSVSSVSGTYHESFNSVTTTLTLRPDRTFRQRYVGASGNIYVTEGKWELHRGDFFGYATVSFDKSIVHSNTIGGSGDEGDVDNGQAVVDHSSLCFNSNASDCLTR